MYPPSLSSPTLSHLPITVSNSQPSYRPSAPYNAPRTSPFPCPSTPLLQGSILLLAWRCRSRSLPSSLITMAKARTTNRRRGLRNQSLRETQSPCGTLLYRGGGRISPFVALFVGVPLPELRSLCLVMKLMRKRKRKMTSITQSH